MHEAGLARAIAEEIIRLDCPADELRLEVTGGHGHPDDFDAALRLHLQAALPGRDVARIRIEHEPVEQVCVACVTPFMAVAPEAACPACGGPGLSAPTPERIVVVRDRAVPRPDRPPEGDERPSPGRRATGTLGT